MITRAMHQELQNRGFTDDARRNMTPTQAQDILSRPAGTPVASEGGLTAEHDHTNAGRYVAKNATGDVVGEGGSPAEAFQQAREAAAPTAAPAREGAPAAPAGAPAPRPVPRAPIKDAVAGRYNPPEQSDLKPKYDKTWQARVAQLPGEARDRAEQARADWEQRAGAPAARPAPVVERRPLPVREAAAERQGRAVEPTPKPPATVGEEMAQRQAARQRGEPVAEGPPTVTRKSKMAREAAAEFEAETKGKYGEVAARGTPVEEISAGQVEAAREAPTRTKQAETVGEAKGVPVAEQGKAEVRAKSTTDKNLLYGDLLHDVLQGTKTAAQAHEAAGEKLPGTVGRPRRQQNFAAYVDERIKLAQEGNKADRALVDQINKAKANTTIPEKTRQAMVDRLQTQLERRKIEREDIKKLQDIRDALPTAEKAAAPKPTRRASAYSPEQVAAGLNRPVAEQMARDSVNQTVGAGLQASEDRGSPVRLHSLLDAIIDHPSAQKSAPHMVALAKALKRFAPDIPVSTYAGWEKFGRPIEQQAGERGVYVSYRPGLDAIAIDPSRSDFQGHVETVLHEATHAATSDYIQNIYDKIQRGERLTPEENIHARAINALGKEVSRVIREGGAETQAEHAMLRYALSAKEGHEIPTVLLSNPYAMEALGRVRASPEFAREMDRLGLGKPQTVWQGFKKIVSSILGLRSDSVLDRAIPALGDVVEAGGRYRAEVGRRALEESIGRRFAPPEFKPGELLTDRIPDERVREATRSLGLRVSEIGLRTGMDKAADKVMAAATDVKSPVSRWLMKNTFVAATTDRLARFNRDVLPQGVNISRVKGQMARYAKDFRDQLWGDPKDKMSLGDRVQNWHREIRKSPELGQLMTDATFAKAHLGSDITDFAARNAHLNPEEMKRAEDLQKTFNGLTEDQQKTYMEVRDYYHSTFLAERAKALENIIGRALPDITPGQRAELGKQVSTPSGLRQLIENPDSTDLARMFQTTAGDVWPSNRAIVQEIAKAHREGSVQGDYFPLRRYGNYVLTYTDKNTGQEGMEMFERRSQANARQEELRARADTGDVSEVLSKAEHPTNDKFIPDRILADIDRALETKKELSPESREAVKQALVESYIKAATRSEAALTRAPRQYVRGASNDQARNLSNDLLATAHRMAHLEYGGAEMDAYQQARNHLDLLEGSTAIRPDVTGRYSTGDQAILDQLGMKTAPTSQQAMRARAAFQEFEQRRSPVDGDTFHSMLASGFTHASLVYHLLRPAHLAVQVMDATMKSMGMLGGKYGYGAATNALQRAVRDVGPTGISQGFGQMSKILHGEMRDSGWNLHQAMAERVIARRGGDATTRMHINELVNQGLDAGVLGRSQALELQRMAQPGAFSSISRAGNMMDLFTMAEHSVDQSLRMANLLAGFDLALARHGGDFKAAAREAVELSQDAMPNYASWNRARLTGPSAPNALLRSGLAQAAMQYHTYGMQMYGTLTSLVRQALFRPGERAEALKSLAGLYGIHALMVGAGAHLFGVPLLAALGAWDMIEGEKRPHDYATDLRRWVTDTFGPTIGTIYSKGLLGLAGVDMTRSLKLANMMDVPEIKTFDKAGFGDALLHVLTGASGDVSGQILNSGEQLIQGNIQRGLVGLAPRMIADPVKAFLEGQQGVLDPRGDVVVQPQDITPGMQIAQTLGFRPYELSLASERRNAEFELKNEVNDARQRAIDRFVQSGGRDMSLVRAYVSNPEYARMSPINITQLQDALKKQRETAMRPGVYGMHVPAKQVPYYQRQAQFQ